MRLLLLLLLPMWLLPLLLLCLLLLPYLTLLLLCLLLPVLLLVVVPLRRAARLQHKLFAVTVAAIRKLLDAKLPSQPAKQLRHRHNLVHLELAPVALLELYLQAVPVRLRQGAVSIAMSLIICHAHRLRKHGLHLLLLPLFIPGWLSFLHSYIPRWLLHPPLALLLLLLWLELL
jgi:ABC-type sugar transport system permease subunit